jgi:hypothetical protein
MLIKVSVEETRFREKIDQPIHELPSFRWKQLAPPQGLLFAISFRPKASKRPAHPIASIEASASNL